MAKSKKNKNFYEMIVDFYIVEIAKSEGKTFAEILQVIDKLPGNEERNVNFDFGPVRLDRLDKRGDILMGDLSRIKMGQLTPVEKLNGKKKTINVSDDEGMGHETAFAFDAKTNCLAIQRNREGVSQKAFKRYVESMAQVQCPIIFKICFSPEKLAKLAQIKKVRKLSFRVAGTQDGELFKGLPGGLSSLMGIRKTMKSPVMEITLSVGRQRDTFLESQDALNIASELFDRESRTYSEITSIEVKGITKDERSTGVDLIKDRLFETCNVQLCKHRTAEYSRRSAKVVDCLMLNRDRISKLK